MSWLIRVCLLLMLAVRIQCFRGHSGEMPSVFHNVSTTPRLHSDVSGTKCSLDLSVKGAHCKSRGFKIIPSDLPPDTKMLDLSGNFIRRLGNESFVRYTLLLYLYLSGNALETIEAGAFRPLANLVTLDLGNNPKLVTVGDVFKWLHQLDILILDSCNFTTVPVDILTSSSRLSQLSMSYNSLASINITSCSKDILPDLNFASTGIDQLIPDMFSILCPVASVDITNQIKSIDPNVIATLKVQRLIMGNFPLTTELWSRLFQGVGRSDIMELSVLNGNLRTVTPDLFSPLSDASLVELDLTFNDIKPLSHSVFSNLTRLRRFILNGNGIRSIEPEHFDGMATLNILDLGYNEIHKINPFNTTWTLNISQLYLQDNEFLEIHSFAFRGLLNLKLLDISNNGYLNTLQMSSFYGLESLVTLDVPGTKLIFLSLWAPLLQSFNMRQQFPYFGDECFIPGKTFMATSMLAFIDLTGTIVQSSTLWDSARNISLFDRLWHLRFLYLDQNPFEHLPVGTFANLTSLQTLSLVNCALSFIERGLFSDLGSLRELSLRYNDLKHLSSDHLVGLGKLQVLRVDDNHISFLSDDLFAKSSELTSLTMTDNDLTTFNQSTFSAVQSSLTTIELVNNPLVCSCDLVWLVDWLRGSIHFLHADQTLCSSASIETLRQKPLLDFRPKDICGPNIILITLLLLSGVGLVALLLVCYHNRLAIGYKVFLLKLAVVGYNEIEDARDHTDFEFDLNIMCDDDDDVWMKAHLRPVLEERLPEYNRNLYGDEDLIIGMHYLDAVHYVVEKSYKTILLLSKKAVQNSWFLVKFRIALDHVNDYQVENMLVIFLEEIPDDELPFLVRLFLSDHGIYLTWTEDEQEKEYFWIKFIKLLKINRKTNHVIPPE